MLTGLFRGSELNAGVIRIDGKDIRNLNLADVRKSMSIIPQDPFLFDGTLRENLDPTGTKEDQELWSVLQKCRLDEKFNTLQNDGLDEKLDEKGFYNLSLFTLEYAVKLKFLYLLVR